MVELDVICISVKADVESAEHISEGTEPCGTTKVTVEGWDVKDWSWMKIRSSNGELVEINLLRG